MRLLWRNYVQGEFCFSLQWFLFWQAMFEVGRDFSLDTFVSGLRDDATMTRSQIAEVIASVFHFLLSIPFVLHNWLFCAGSDCADWRLCTLVEASVFKLFMLCLFLFTGVRRFINVLQNISFCRFLRALTLLYLALLGMDSALNLFL